MRILVCGSRNWANKGKIRAVLSHYTPQDVIIQGCCRGADTLAKEVAQELGMSVEDYPAHWGAYGRRAGPIRNSEMLEANIDLVIAFCNDLTVSTGTKDLVTKAQAKGVPYVVIGS